LVGLKTKKQLAAKVGQTAAKCNWQQLGAIGSNKQLAAFWDDWQEYAILAAIRNWQRLGTIGSNYSQLAAITANSSDGQYW